MGDSFTTAVPLSRLMSQPREGKPRVLVTGAAGNIGSYFARHSADRYDLRLMVHEKDEDVEPIKGCGEVVLGDVTRLDRMKELSQGMDVILHLAANPSPEGTWSTILPLNIEGTYNVFAAAKANGVRRVVYASSIHAVSGYPADVQVGPDFPVNPGDLYGVSKCFGEALGRYMAEQEGVACIAIRIGAFQPLSEARKKESVKMMDAYVSQRDLNQLLQKAVEAEHLKWAVVNGLSDNHFKRLDITSARELLGYEPRDDLTEMNPDLEKLHLHDVSSHQMVDPEESGLREDV
jgi:nucleoside-diphosphate-sugar epimerase